MTSLDTSHIPHLAGRDKHTGGPATVQTRSRSGTDSAKHVVAVPDLRFEQSYLKSIAPYVQTRRVAGGADGGGAREIVGVQWKKVLWITARDQLISPLLQGSAWGIAQLFVRPLMANIRAFFGFGKRLPDADPSSAKPADPKGDGELTLRLRAWSKELKGGLEPNLALST